MPWYNWLAVGIMNLHTEKFYSKITALPKMDSMISSVHIEWDLVLKSLWITQFSFLDQRQGTLTQCQNYGYNFPTTSSIGENWPFVKRSLSGLWGHQRPQNWRGGLHIFLFWSCTQNFIQIRWWEPRQTAIF